MTGIQRLDLPEGLTQRPLAHDDAERVAELVVTQELCDVGVSEFDAADLLGDWQRPSFDLATSAVGVFDGDECAHRSAPSCDPLVLGGKEGVLRACRGHRRNPECAFEVRVPGTCFCRLDPASGFVGAR